MKKITGSKKRISKVISVLIAILVWIFVIYSENPSIDFKLNAIDVQLINESSLLNKNLMIVEKNSISDASIVIRGKRQDLISVMGNISASVDLSQISEPGVYKLQPVFDIPSNAVYISKRNTRYIEVTVKEMEEKTVPVTIIQKNSDKNKSFIVESLPEKSTMTVKGTADDIERIDHAAIYIDVAAMTQTNSETYNYVFEDENNSEILPINDIISDQSILVKNNVYDKITLDINLSIPSDIDDKYTVELISQDVDQVSVGIKSLEGRNVQSITNITEFENLTPGTNKYQIKLIQPDGIYLPPESQYVTVELEVFEKEEKTLEVPLNVKNTSNKTYTLQNNTVQVSISGPKEKLTSDNVKAELNLDSVSGTGEQTVSVKPSTSEKDITIEDTEVFVNVIIEE